MYLDAPFLKFPRNDVGGAMLLQAKLGIGMDVLPDVGQFGVVATDLVNRGWHGVLLSQRRL
jgi:hypothetical protein